MASRIDIATVVTPGGYADWAIDASGDLVMESGLTTMVLHALLTDARVRDSDPHPTDPREDPRGWWADSAENEQGGHLWVLARAKATAETRRLVEGYAREALQRRLIDSGIAEELVISSEWARGGRLCLRVEVVRGNAARWPVAWAGTPRPLDLGGRYLVHILARG